MKLLSLMYDYPSHRIQKNSAFFALRKSYAYNEREQAANQTWLWKPDHSSSTKCGKSLCSLLLRVGLIIAIIMMTHQ